MSILYTFSARITPHCFEDLITPHVVSVFNNTTDFPVCLIFREFSKGKKLHYHLFFKTSLTDSAVRKKIKLHYAHNRGHSLHPIAVGDNIICTKSSHNKPNCLIGAKTYTAKEGDVIYRHGISQDETNKFIIKGKEILSFNKQKTHKKIIQKYKLNEDSTSKSIVLAYLSYRQDMGHAGFPANKYAVQGILTDIAQALDPSVIDYFTDEYEGYLDQIRPNYERISGTHLPADPFEDYTL